MGERLIVLYFKEGHNAVMLAIALHRIGVACG
jgi:hypothetical protein